MLFSKRETPINQTSGNTYVINDELQIFLFQLLNVQRWNFIDFNICQK